MGCVLLLYVWLVGEADHELDLLSLIDKIRSLKYTTLKEFQLDLNNMRNRIESKLSRYHTYMESTINDNNAIVSSEGTCVDLTEHTQGSVFESKRKVVLQAFDTLVDANYNFFSGKEFVISTLEDGIRQALAGQAADNAVVCCINAIYCRNEKKKLRWLNSSI